MASNFESLQLRSGLSSTISALGWSACTPIQESVIPAILQGKDVAGLAQTGTGKTGAFLVPLLERMLCSRVENPTEADLELIKQRAFPNWQKNNLVLILVPTRELAEQVAEQANKLGTPSGLKVEAIYGGVGYEKQKHALREGHEIIVATPGRLIDLYKEHLLDLRQVRAIVFDEADRMFDMGFKDDMKFLLGRIPRDRQFLVFSATLNFDVLNTAYQFGAHPVEFNISRDQAKAENVKDEIFHVGQEEKAKYLLSIFKKLQPKQAIVFSNFKNNVGRIAKFLGDNGVAAVGISSLLTQAQRNRVMEQFKDQDHPVNVLVATDVAARGLDVQGVDLVVNFELPDDPENYVHRIGRTGRAGALGRAYSFVSDRDVDALTRVEDYLQHKVTIGWLEDSELVSEFKPFPNANFGEGKPYSPAARSSDSRHGSGRYESGRGNGRGGNRRDSRNEPRRGRGNSRPDHMRKEGVGGAGSPDTGQQQKPQQHRDRTMGRHGGRTGENGGRSNQTPFKDKRHGQRSADSRPAHPSKQSSAPRKPQMRSPHKSKVTTQTPPIGVLSLGQKVSRFFKKIFKDT